MLSINDIVNWIRAGWPHDYLPPMIALGAFAWSFWTYRSAKQRERFKLGIDMILKLGERFDSPAMAKHRCEAATALLADRTVPSLAADCLFDFFEDVGFLLRRGAIDVESIDAFFSYWLGAYYCASREYRARRSDELVWVDFETLGARLEQFEDYQMFWIPFRWLHWLLWHLYRKRKPSNRWLGLSAGVRVILQEETRLVQSDMAHFVGRYQIRRYGKTAADKNQRP